MVNEKYIEEQLKELVKRSQRNTGVSKWTKLQDIMYRAFTASKIDKFSHTVDTLQTAEEMLFNLETDLDYEDYEILEKEATDEGFVVYIRTMPHLSLAGYGALVAVELKKNFVSVSIFDHDIPDKTIHDYELTAYIVQTIVLPAESAEKAVLKQEVDKKKQALHKARQNSSQQEKEKEAEVAFQGKLIE